MSLINLSLEIVYCSNLDSSCDLQTNCAMRFLFCLDLSLPGKKLKFGIMQLNKDYGKSKGGTDYSIPNPCKQEDPMT